MRTLPIAVLAVALTACGLDNFDLEVQEETTIPGNPLGSTLDPIPFGGGFSGMDLLDDSELRDEGVEAEDIDSAKVEALRLELLSGSSFETWLEDVSFYVEGEGLPRQLVAEQHGIGALPEGTILLDLDVSGAELKPYVSRPITIVTEVVGRPPVDDSRVRATLVVGVDADVSNFIGL
jgi:hypothetical protein